MCSSLFICILLCDIIYQMEESFELLSSMSPKIKGLRPIKKAKPTILALKKHFRRSFALDDAVKTVHNKDLTLTEVSTDSSRSSNSSNIKLLNETPIVVPDSNSESEEEDIKNRVHSENVPLSQVKVHQIQHWIDELVEFKPKDDFTMFSEVSTIIAEDIPKFEPEGTGCAISSTMNSLTNRRFDELFKKGNVNMYAIEESKVDNIIIEDSFELEGKSAESKEDVTKIDRIIDDSFEPVRGSKSKLEISESLGTPEQFNVENADDQPSSEVESVLDSLYGDKWRSVRTHVLPKSEPRTKKTESCDKKNVVNSERKPKLSLLYKNPYLEQNTGSLFKSMINKKSTTESPWIEKLNNICDSESSLEMSYDVRTKLNFDDDSNGEKTSKYFPKVNKITSTSSKRESDSDFGLDEDEPLTERIKNKLNEDKPKSKIKSGKFENKENNFNITDKKNKEPHDSNKNYNSVLRENNSNLKIQGKGTESTLDNNKSVTKKDKKDAVKKTEKDKNTTQARKVRKNNGRNAKKIEFDSESVSSDEDWDQEISRILEKNKERRKTLFGKTCSFLASLSKSVPLGQCDPAAHIFRNNFKQYRDELTSKLYKIYNERVFDNKLDADMPFEWSDRLRGTAGYCSCKKLTRRNGAVERQARIVLSTKVLDSADRLRDTFIHELCHAAAWIVNGVSDGHGPYWKSWAFKAMNTFPELPPIKRCHDYVINTKYTYKCTGCGYCVGRHTKSLDIERKRCGYCYGKFEVLINKTSKKGETKAVPVTPRKETTGFALFVKENYALYKNPQRNHGDVMKLLGQKFSEMKLKSK